VLVCALGLLVGCTRAHYRNWADAETYPIIQERILRPQFDIGRTEIWPDPASRLAEPFDPDHPPKPPDDPAAALFMERPGGMRGAKHWDRDGVTYQIEPAGWEAVLAPDEQGVVHLNPDTALEVALLSSREYQTTVEDVYLAALTLTLNRFEFALQWFGRTSTAYTHFGTGGAPTETNTLDVESALGFTRNFAAGGQLLVNFANSLVFEYTNDQKRWGSNLTFSFLQPLLRGAGRKVRLESLTQQERNVLYAVRSFARFRKQFWANVVMDNGGYLDLLLAVQTLRNNRENQRRQEETYRLYNETFLAGRSSPLARDQSFQGVLSARLSVIQAEIALQNQLDAYKLRLGVPPRVAVELDDSLLNVFVLTDSDLEETRIELEAFQRQRFAELDAPPTADDLRLHFEQARNFADRLPAFIERVSAGLDEWGAELNQQPDPGADQDLIAQAHRTYAALRDQIPDMKADLDRVVDAIDRHRDSVNEENRQESWELLVADLNTVKVQLDAIISVQSQTKIYQIELPEVDLTEAAALDIAKEGRLDLQNQLAQITDSWRKVWVAANALKGTLNVNATANLATDPDHLQPLNFAADTSAYTVGFQFDGPLNRLAERNAYRASLIALQRARRNYMALSDTIEQQIRRDLRQLNQLRVSFEISRQSLLVAARQVESARLALITPDRNQNQDTLATTNQLLTALGNLVNARNALAGNYINYQQQRVQLLLDLEELQLDPRGFPTDVSLRFTASGFPDAAGSLDAAQFSGTSDFPDARGAEELPPGTAVPVPNRVRGQADVPGGRAAPEPLPRPAAAAAEPAPQP
jgi:outer membrane protein TolC